MQAVNMMAIRHRAADTASTCADGDVGVCGTAGA